MIQAVARRRAWLPAGLMAFVLLGGCEALLDTGGLAERGAQDGGGPDSMTGDGSESTVVNGQDSTTPSGRTDSSTDATIEAAEDGSGYDGGLEAPNEEGGSEAGECTPPEAKCVGGGVATCTEKGTYGAAVTCPSGVCAMGMCTGSCEAGASQCSGNAMVQTCVSGMWGTPVTCTNQTCISATAMCTGMCAPGQTHPIACGNCGTDMQTCSAAGAWLTSGTCAGQGVCSPTGTQSCNTYGTQTCSSSCAWSACSCASTPVCTPNATRCSGNGVQTCNTCGQWGGAVACPSTTPNCSAGVCGEPSSCQVSVAGTTNCGGSSESCCTSLEVTPNGSYYRTYTNSGSGPTGEADSASITGFRMDKYLVTVGRFRQFVSAWNNGSGYMPSAGSGKHTYLNAGQGLANSGSAGTYETGWDATDWNNTTDIDPTTANMTSCSPYSTWTASAGSQENLPINCVTWWEAYAFCIWDGGFLPSEAEWQYAAAGGSEQLEYPWGSTAPGMACPGTGCQYAIYNCDYPSGSGSCRGVTNIAPVGTATLGVGLWGQLDLAGEVWEWNLDWYASYVDPCTDCADLTAATGRVVRGNSYNNGTSTLPVAERFYGISTERDGYIGLRCERNP
jgi:sulfatase modifying factor 1